MIFPKPEDQKKVNLGNGSKRPEEGAVSGSHWASCTEPEQHILVFTYYINSLYCVPALHNYPATYVLAPVYSKEAEAQRSLVVCPRPQRLEVALPGSKTQQCGSGVQDQCREGPHVMLLRGCREMGIGALLLPTTWTHGAAAWGQLSGDR